MSGVVDVVDLGISEDLDTVGKCEIDWRVVYWESSFGPSNGAVCRCACDMSIGRFHFPQPNEFYG